MATGPRLDISYQTLYSELVQRSLDESFTSEFSSNGRFVAVEIKDKKYWYFDTPRPDAAGQNRRYVGPVDDPEITKRVEAFKVHHLAEHIGLDGIELNTLVTEIARDQLAERLLTCRRPR